MRAALLYRQRRPFFHAQQTQAGAEDRLRPDRSHLKPDPIVPHPQVELSLLLFSLLVMPLMLLLLLLYFLLFLLLV